MCVFGVGWLFVKSLGVTTSRDHPGIPKPWLLAAYRDYPVIYSRDYRATITLDIQNPEVWCFEAFKSRTSGDLRGFFDTDPHVRYDWMSIGFVHMYLPPCQGF